jgi:hypothetical protein
VILLALIAAVGGLIALLWTRRTRLHEIAVRLHQAQFVLDGENRLATLGRFASVIAHEVGLARGRGSELYLVSRDGHGARFQIRLPQADSNLDTAA